MNEGGAFHFNFYNLAMGHIFHCVVNKKIIIHFSYGLYKMYTILNNFARGRGYTMWYLKFNCKTIHFP